ERRPGVCTFRPRLPRGNAPLPHLRRRSHAPPHARRNRDSRSDRQASKARLIRNVEDDPLTTALSLTSTPSLLARGPEFDVHGRDEPSNDRRWANDPLSTEKVSERERDVRDRQEASIHQAFRSGGWSVYEAWRLGLSKRDGPHRAPPLLGRDSIRVS